jgi:putative transposase
MSCADFVPFSEVQRRWRYGRCMGRQLRQDFEGALHHVYARGNRRQDIADESLDYRFLLWLVERAVERFKWEVHSYCLMPNHYHFLIETPEAGLSRGMQLINGRYAQAFNAGRGLDGHLFQGRFGSKLVESESHAIWVNRYIPRNPVEAKLVTGPAAWFWSSYGALRRGAAPAWLAHDRVLALWGGGERAAIEYERLILDEEGPDPPGHAQGLTPDRAYWDVRP